jgi:glycosyltransferase involved in cell wall biosynthesis
MINFTMQVRDRFRLTKQALESLAASGLHGMTVTVQDDRSHYETQNLVHQWCNENGAYYIRNNEPLGTGQLRNNVMEASRKFWGQGDYVAPHDNDTYFKPGWLGAMLKADRFAWDHDYRILGAYGHPYHLPVSELPVTKGSYVLFNVREVQALATQSMFMRWSVWDTYGPFCDTPVDKTCQSEDVDFTNRIRKDGYKLGVVYPHLIHATALKNTFGEPGPGWELVKAECPPHVICE